jgi:hypothetical protein
MFRKQVSPRTVLIATVIILSVVQFTYWRLLVFEPPGPPFQGGGGGGAFPESVPFVAGLTEVTVETLTGDEPGYLDGHLWEARFAGPSALAFDPEGNLLVADSRNHRIRKVALQGRVTTLAGGAEPNGPGGRSEGPASSAGFRYPSGIAVGADGALYISDTGNHRICRLSGGNVATFAGGTPGRADGAGGGARFLHPGPLTVGPDGALWVADAGNGIIRRVELSGAVSTPADVPPAVTCALGALRKETPPARLDSVADFYLERRGPGVLLPASGGAAESAWALFGDTQQHLILGRQGDAAPIVVAGRCTEGSSGPTTTDEDGSRAGFAFPCSVVRGPDYRVYVADYESNRIRRLTVPEWLLGASDPSSPDDRRPFDEWRSRRRR